MYITKRQIATLVDAIHGYDDAKTEWHKGFIRGGGGHFSSKPIYIEVNKNTEEQNKITAIRLI